MIAFLFMLNWGKKEKEKSGANGGGGGGVGWGVEEKAWMTEWVMSDNENNYVVL